MKYEEAKQGRIFILRLYDGEIIHEEIEKFAVKKNIQRGFMQLVGGVDKGSRVVVGPEEGRADTIIPMEYVLDDVYECTGVGTLFPDIEGNPIVHIHMAFGRSNSTVTGCIRRGVKVWHVLEVILTELTGANAKRMFDENTGFELLEPRS